MKGEKIKNANYLLKQLFNSVILKLLPFKVFLAVSRVTKYCHCKHATQGVTFGGLTLAWGPCFRKFGWIPLIPGSFIYNFIIADKKNYH